MKVSEQMKQQRVDIGLEAELAYVVERCKAMRADVAERGGGE
jgi:hypothetical protein